MRRGDIVIVAPPGDFNKPRPALILQEAIYSETELVTVALITSDLLRQPYIRVPIEPTEQNGLRLAALMKRRWIGSKWRWLCFWVSDTTAKRGKSRVLKQILGCAKMTIKFGAGFQHLFPGCVRD